MNTLPAGLTDADVERAARAIFESRMVPADYRVAEPWGGRDTVTKTFCRQAALAALTAVQATLITTDAIDAIIADNVYIDNDGVAGISAAAEALAAMIAAAPPSPVGEKP